MEKKCFKCGVVKDIGSFYKHKQMKDGHLNKCIDCAKTDVRQHRRENESVREYDRRRYRENPARREASAANTKKYNAENPERYRARYLLTNAVRDKRVTKEPCEVCGVTKYIHGHHDDYSKPLEVRWLCAKHHHRYHAKERYEAP